MLLTALQYSHTFALIHLMIYSTVLLPWLRQRVLGYLELAMQTEQVQFPGDIQTENKYFIYTALSL